MKYFEPNPGYEFPAPRGPAGSGGRSWRTIITSIVTIATGTVALGLGLLYFLVSAPA